MKRSPKQRKYSFMAFRPSGDIETRIRAIAKKSGRSVSSIIYESVNVHLPKLESFHR